MPENPRRAIPVLPPINRETGYSNVLVLPPPPDWLNCHSHPFLSFFLSFSTPVWFLLWQNGGKVVGWWHADGIITAFPFPLKLHSFTNLSPFISDLFIKLTRFHPLSSPSLHFGCLKVKLTQSLSSSTPQSSPYQIFFTKVLLTLSSLGIRVLTSSSRGSAWRKSFSRIYYMQRVANPAWLRDSDWEQDLLQSENWSN